MSDLSSPSASSSESSASSASPIRSGLGTDTPRDKGELLERRAGESEGDDLEYVEGDDYDESDKENAAVPDEHSNAGDDEYEEAASIRVIVGMAQTGNDDAEGELVELFLWVRH
jgi:hypothetical protein